ncbi:MAG: hypothetical protein AAFV53_09485 [Myxococcota bacterium]
MTFWSSGVMMDGVWLCALLLVSWALIQSLPFLRRLALPPPLLAGIIGLFLGPSAMGFLPFQPETFEFIVYHGLALIFISVSLQPAPPRTDGRAVSLGSRSMAFAIPFMAVTQGLIGLTVVAGYWALGFGELHPGVGLMLPLAFGQGPGQALSLGTAWEASGMADGGQIGLIMSAIGFIWCAAVGVPWASYGARKGWATPLPDPPDEPMLGETLDPKVDTTALHVSAVGVVYLVTAGLLVLITDAIADNTQLVAMVWGFHFLIGMAVGLFVRTVLARTPGKGLLKREELSRIATVVVAFSTTAAISAVKLSVLVGMWGPILMVTMLGGVATFAAALWLTKRVFPEAPFEHGLVWFGAATGTLHTGLALLQSLDPELRGSAPNSAVVGSAGALLLSAPLLLFVIPYTITDWQSRFPGVTFAAIGILAIYMALLVVGWRLGAPLRFLRPLGSIWPSQPHPQIPPSEMVDIAAER